MSSKCEVCKTRLGLFKFHCQFCQLDFCCHHRLPEDHSCKNIADVNKKYKEDITTKIRAQAIPEDKMSTRF